MGKKVTCQALDVPAHAWGQLEQTVRSWANRSGYRADRKGDSLILARGDGVSSAKKCIEVDRSPPASGSPATVFAYLLTVVGDRKIAADSTYWANLPARALRKDRDALLAWIQQHIQGVRVSQSAKLEDGVISSRQNLWITLLVFVGLLALVTLWVVFFLLPRIMG